MLLLWDKPQFIHFCVFFLKRLMMKKEANATLRDNTSSAVPSFYSDSRFMGKVNGAWDLLLQILK